MNQVKSLALRPTTVNSTLELTTPEFFTFENTIGATGYGALFKPANYDSSRKYPTVVIVYGGPHVQVKKQFSKLKIINKARRE